MNAKTIAERVAAHRARMKEQGMVLLTLWVHENDVSRIKRDAAAHAARRVRLLKQGLEIPSLEDEEARAIATIKKMGKGKAK